MTPSWYSFALAFQIAGALLVIANLAGCAVRERFERGASAVWTSPDPALRWLRWTIMLHFAAIPMLLVYAWMQPIVSTTTTLAVILAGLLSMSVALAVAGKVIGALGLILGGLGLLAHTGLTVCGAYEQSAAIGQIALYYTVFWAPAGVCAAMCGVRLARPVLRMLQR